jgi:hypothetical protein
MFNLFGRLEPCDLGGRDPALPKIHLPVGADDCARLMLAMSSQRLRV